MYRDVAVLVRAAAPAIWLHLDRQLRGRHLDTGSTWMTTKKGPSVSHAVEATQTNHFSPIRELNQRGPHDNRHNILPPVRSLLYQVIIETTHHEAVYQDESPKCAPIHSSRISAPRPGSPVSRVNLSPQTITLARLNEEVLTPRNPVNGDAPIPPKPPATNFQFCKNLKNGNMSVDVESCVDFRQDNRNCGKCNNVCGLRESCVDFKCVPKVLEKPANQTAPANGTNAA
ncbi:hypothetical protein K456DRAFT_1920199 [Colletotrichum gloeosporioides 23]|nr:hypothetical protein K456DRAFT_1920199 [Colletotrichum gloeosporioides 23]